MKFAEVEVSAKFFKTVGGIPSCTYFLIENLLNNYIIKISEGKYIYFKYNFNEKNNYAHNFDEIRVLL